MSDQPEKEAALPLLRVSSAATAESPTISEQSDSLQNGSSAPSFFVGAESSSATQSDNDNVDSTGLNSPKKEGNIGKVQSSPCHGEPSSPHRQTLPSRDAESIMTGSEIERNSSKGSLRGPVLTDPNMSKLEEDPVREMRKSVSEQVSGITHHSPTSVCNHLSVPNGRLKLDEMISSNISLTKKGHHIIIEEVAPSTSSILEGQKDKEWKMSINPFSTAKQGKDQVAKSLPRSVRRYYKTQDSLIEAYEELHVDVEDAMSNSEDMARLARQARILAQVSFAVNLALLISKSIAAGLSGSLAVISSVIDSAVDLVSGGLMWWSGRAIKKRNIYHYPQGRTKLEPVAIVVLSVVMALASVQMIRESIEKIIAYATSDAKGPVFEVPSIVICCVTIVAKLVLYLVCRRVKTPSVGALTQDHRNDVVSNTAALACGLIGYKKWKYADPIGAIIISLYIVVSWFKTGWEQIKMLTGHTARPDFLKKITWIALNHHSKVMLIDTVRAFHFGSNFLVEVDIVLPEDMSLRESHDIGESLQAKIENLQEVERAFVHLDYECEHHPHSEHKQV